MKKFISTIQNLSERAAQLQAAMQSAPPKFAELREAVALTTGQLQQLKSEVEQGISDLKTDNEVQLLDSLREINSSVLAFQQAGYELGGVDMELSPVQRLIVHLDRVEDISLATLRSLLNSNQHRRVTHALIKSLIQAEEMADQVDLENLVYYKLIVNVGPVPAVRLCWRQENLPVQSLPTTASSPELDHPVVPTRKLPSFGEGSFFERRIGKVSEPVGVNVQAPEPLHNEAAASASTEPKLPVTAEPTKATPPLEPVRSFSGGKDWGKSSLERFKKMPSVSKYRR